MSTAVKKMQQAFFSTTNKKDFIVFNHLTALLAVILLVKQKISLSFFRLSFTQRITGGIFYIMLINIT